MKYANKSGFELESELYATVTSLNKLYEKFQKGKLNSDFFQKSFRNFVYDLFQIKMRLKEKRIPLSEIIKDKSFIKEYNNAIFIIEKFSSSFSSKNLMNNRYRDNERYSKIFKSSFLYLPGITFEITSNFITLMDALKLDASVGTEFILNLFEDLLQKLDQFPGLNSLHLKVEKLYSHIKKNVSSIERNKEYREKAVDHLFRLFKEFQNLISLKL